MRDNNLHEPIGLGIIKFKRLEIFILNLISYSYDYSYRFVYKLVVARSMNICIIRRNHFRSVEKLN